MESEPLKKLKLGITTWTARILIPLNFESHNPEKLLSDYQAMHDQIATT